MDRVIPRQVVQRGKKGMVELVKRSKPGKNIFPPTPMLSASVDESGFLPCLPFTIPVF